MIRAAIIVAGRVVNIVAEAKLRPGQVDITGRTVNPGDYYDEATDTFSPGPADPLPVREITAQAFRSRFTDAELAAIVSSNDAAVKVLVLKIATRTTVDLADPQTAEGVDLLIAKGLVQAGRRAALLA